MKVEIELVPKISYSLFLRKNCYTFDCLSLYNILELFSWGITFKGFRAKYNLQDIHIFVVISLCPLIAGVEGYSCKCGGLLLQVWRVILARDHAQ
jgi:hypothetical protein